MMIKWLGVVWCEMVRRIDTYRLVTRRLHHKYTILDKSIGILLIIEFVWPLNLL